MSKASGPYPSASMKRYRQKYYDFFSGFYDRFVAWHSSDRQGELKKYLADKSGAQPGDRVLDICTGTGTLLAHLLNRIDQRGLVVGLDFSSGMLARARQKYPAALPVGLIQADAGYLPFKDSVFDALTCAHAFYELRGKNQDRTLCEIKRVLKSRRSFLMMEHDVPQNFFIRMFFYLRLLSMGTRRALQILKKEQLLLQRYFESVEKETTVTGRSKILVCRSANKSAKPG